MEKIKMKVSIISNNQTITQNLEGVIEKGIISYQEEDKTSVYLDINENKIIRENVDMILSYQFLENKETIGTIFIKDLNKELELGIKTNNIRKEEYIYCVDYEINGDKFKYEIRYGGRHELY